jgi:hypothetical protein
VSDRSERDVAANLVFAKYQPDYGGDPTGWRAAALPVAGDLGSDTS